MNAYLLTAIAGWCFLLSGLLIGFREILLRPTDNDYFPTAPFWLRSLMFAYMTALVLTGTNLMFSLQHADPIFVHPIIVVLAVVMVVYKLGMAVNLLNQWLPVPVRARLDRMQKHAFRLARCGRILPAETPAVKNLDRAAALVELEVQGATVVPPNASESDFVEIIVSSGGGNGHLTAGLH